MADNSNTTNSSRRRVVAPALLAADAAVFSALDQARQLRGDIVRFSRLTDEVAAERDGRPVVASDKARLSDALEAYDTALQAVCDARPNTLAGLRARLEWLVNHAEDLTSDLVSRFAGASIYAI